MLETALVLLAGELGVLLITLPVLLVIAVGLRRSFNVVAPCFLRNPFLALPLLSNCSVGNRCGVNRGALIGYLWEVLQ
jgi:hypothetical protein